MCLYNPTQIFPENHIVTYKVFRKNIFSKKLYSPFYHFKWKTNKKYSTNVDKPTLFSEINEIFTPTLVKPILKATPMIEGGAFHSFKFLEDAIFTKNSINHKNIFNKIVIYKCIIPTSSKFIYEGLCASNKNGLPSYASESLIPIEEIK